MLDDRSAGADPTGSADSAPTSVSRRAARGGASTVLAAAMIAVGEVIEPHKTQVEIVRPADGSDDGLDLELDFGDLPEL